MANRRSLDSSYTFLVAKNHFGLISSRHKATFLALALISCLISINCASFGRLASASIDHQQWRNQQPSYGSLSSSSNQAEEDLADRLLGLSKLSSLSGYQSQPRQQNDGQSAFWQQQAASLQPNYYTLISTSKSKQPAYPTSESSEEADQQQQQLYNQLMLARSLLDSNNNPPAYASPSLIQPKNDYQFNSENSYQSDNSADISNNIELADSNQLDKLVESLRLQTAIRDSENNADNQQLLQDGAYNLPFNIDSKSSPLFFPLDPQQSQESSSLDSGLGSWSGAAKQHGNNGHENDAYQVEESGKSKKSDQEVGRTELRNDEQKHNLTTLLEDEDADGQDNKGEKERTTKSPVNEAQVPTTTASYGVVITASSGDNNRQTTTKEASTPSNSMFARIYNKLASYMPFLDKKAQAADSLHETPRGTYATFMPSIQYHQQEENGDTTQSSAQVSANTKLDVSSPDDQQQSTSKSARVVVVEENKGDASKSEGKSDGQGNNNDKQTKGLKVNSKKSHSYGNDMLIADSSQPADSSMFIEDSDNSNDDQRQLSRGKTFRLHAPIHEIEIKERLPKGEHKINFLRQSSLVMPYKANDELVVQSSSLDNQPDSLLGKYIYAPQHHYHLNTAAPSGHLGDIDDLKVKDKEHMFSKAHRSYSHRLIPADDDDDDAENALYGAGAYRYAGGLRQDGPMGMIANKSNDVYFLMMVGAFCVMAMAVVLSAGLFAYRVQQGRRSNSDADYPTYGVVGPNNMTGKCGNAASFVGGYFGHTGGPGSSTSGSKAGSTKHLADLYSASGDSGVASGGSLNKQQARDKKASSQESNGNNSNFMVNQNAARMYHYQHQKQQMIISDRASAGRNTSASDLDSEDENDDGDYTVYECPGLASAHEMEIKNPLFNDDQTR